MPLQHANYRYEILKQDHQNGSLSQGRQSLSPTLTPSSRKLHLKNSTYHTNTAQSLTMFPFQAEIFPLSMICSLHNAAAAEAAVAVAVALG